MSHKKIEDFILDTGDGIVVDYVNGQFVIENKNFVEGKQDCKIKIKVFGNSVDTCVDNFVYHLEQIEYKKNNPEKDDVESYRWYCSY
jgi:hypothetical protein